MSLALCSSFVHRFHNFAHGTICVLKIEVGCIVFYRHPGRLDRACVISLLNFITISVDSNILAFILQD